MFSSLMGFALLSLALPSATFATSGHAAPHRRHAAIVAHHNATTAHNTTLESRGDVFTPARLTYYDVGLGACGKVNVPGDFIVALNSPQYGGGYPGPNCFRPIAITYNGNTIHATVMDECPGCPWAGLDLSKGLFSAFDSLDKGVLTASWRFTDGDEGNDQPSSSSPKPTPTSKKTTSTQWTPTTHWTPTPTWTPELTPEVASKKTSSVKTETTTSKTSTSTSTSTRSTETTTSTSSEPPKTTPSTSTPPKSTSSETSTSTSSTAAATPAGPDTLEKLEQSFIGLANLALAAEVAV